MPKRHILEWQFCSPPVRCLNILQLSILPNLIYWFSAIPIKILKSDFVYQQIYKLKFIWKDKRPSKRKTNTILKKNNVWGLILPNLKTYYKAKVIIQTVWYWWKNRQKDQWDRIEILKTDLHKYNQLIFDKGTKSIQWRKRSLFNKWYCNNWTSTCERRTERERKGGREEGKKEGKEREEE